MQSRINAPVIEVISSDRQFQAIFQVTKLDGSVFFTADYQDVPTRTQAVRVRPNWSNIEVAIEAEQLISSGAAIQFAHHLGLNVR